MKRLFPLLVLLSLSVCVHAQTFPSRPIRIVVTYPPGGGADLVARLIAPKMAEALGQPVVVENKAGASGQIAANEVAHAAPDGYTLMLDAMSYAVNPSLYSKLSYDPAKAFTAVSVIALFPNVMVVTPSFDAKNVADVVAAARAKPGSISFASSGNGSAQHLAGELFRQRTSLDIVHVPYKGGGPALNDVMGGQVPLFFANMASSLGHIKAGKLRALAVTSAKRSPALPDVPTMEEAGVGGYQVYEWNAIFAPSGTPAPVLAKIADSIHAALKAPDVRSRIEGLGGEIADYGPAQAGKFVRAQTELWGSVVRAANIKVE